MMTVDNMRSTAKIEIRDLVMIYAPNRRTLKRACAEYRAGRTAGQLFSELGVKVGVDSVSLDIPDGGITAVMGLSGSGKSTLLKCINLLNRPVFGEIMIDGSSIMKYSRAEVRELRRKRVSMVFQDFGLLAHRTVLENAAFGLEVSGADRHEARARALAVLETVGLKGWENRRPHELSGGMQQRVGLARALAGDPEILLMDEPFSALDPLIRQQMQDELLDMQSTMRKTIVFITHDIYEAFRLGSRVAIMKDGRIHQIGTPGEIMRMPATDYVKSFINSASKTIDLWRGESN